MAEIAYTHTAGPRGRAGKYPWSQLTRVGDYFDAPSRVRRGVSNAAYYHGVMTGKRVRTFPVGGDKVRVMLVEIEDGSV